jgi:glycosyltransferase involved in cell wall biosynthesis
MVKNSDYLVSITQEFIDYLNQDSNRKSNKNIVTYLTSKKSKSVITSEAKKDEILTIGFAGSFMDAFDFHPICTAINNINNNTNIQFLLAGDGGSRKKVQKMFTELTNVDFLGWLDGDELNEFFSKIDLFIIPLKQRNDFSLSFPNKAMDALSKSKPILCSCDGSLTNFLEKNQCGLYYDPSSNTDLSKILDNLYTDRTLITKMITNIERIYDNSFNHQKNYQHLVSKIVDSN